MFKFDFPGDEVDDKTKPCPAAGDTLDWFPAKEVTVFNVNHYKPDNGSRIVVPCGEFKLVHTRTRLSELQENGSNQIFEAELLHSDLLPAKYEGGLKVWECTFDLLDFVMETTPDWTGRTVLDLGCGAGLLGILALKLGATVHFQDYNESVLTSLTIPNILLNVRRGDKERALSNCKFFAGDWLSFSEMMDHKYDFILTSETIYNPDNHSKILHVLQHHLRADAVAFVAAKTHYFGVGGGLRQFEEALAQDGFQSSVCWKCPHGLKREIIKVSRKI